MKLCRQNRDKFTAGLILPFEKASLQNMDMTPGTVQPSFSISPETVALNRIEIGTIMRIYGRMVAAGEWRDYSMSFLKGVAIFAIFRRAAEHPIYQIEKRPALRHKQGMYAVIGVDGRVLKRGHDLKAVMRVLERKLIRSVS